nr:glycosyltransferase family 4 protein [Chenggangzhangella methanolivorans]
MGRRGAGSRALSAGRRPARLEGRQGHAALGPKRTSLEAICHTLVGLVAARRLNPDVVHIHAIGPSLAAPVARALGLKLVVTHHGFDYNRQKWGRFAKTALRLGERLGMRFANRRIAISQEVATYAERRYGKPVSFIPNGVDVAGKPNDVSALQAFGLESGRYVVMVARIVPEKRQLDLIAAFAKLGDLGFKLALVGYAEHGGDYLRRVEAAAKTTPGVVMTGFKVDEELAQLFGHAALFVLPSSHEGMPIALLEALALGVPVLASDISPNLALRLPPDDYFPLGDVDRLAAAMREKLTTPPDPAAVAARIVETEQAYGWGPVVDATIAVYDEARAS